MHCFNHESVAAIAICKFCGRGICRECAIVQPQGIYCSPDCKVATEETENAVEVNRRLLQKAPTSTFVSAALELAVGILFLALTQFPFLGGASPVLVVMGLLLILAAVYHFVCAIRFRREHKRP